MGAKILKATQEAIAAAASLIRGGEVVAFPTETVYGLGADCFNPRAVAKIFEVKERPHFDPLIVHIAQKEGWRELASSGDRRVEALTERFWPGPLTLVLPKREVVPDIVTSGLPTVAVRMPSHPVALALIKEAKTPIAAPSANLFGRLSPTSAEEVAEQLKERIPLILDGGRCPVGVESTIISLLEDPPRLLRPGGVPVEEIEMTIGEGVKKESSSSTAPQSPGQLPSHYAPRTPLRLLEERCEAPQGVRAGLLAFTPPEGDLGYAAVEVLSERGDLVEAAYRLFSALRRLDRSGVEVIYAERVPEVGLGRAIMDRLRKAANKFEGDWG